MSNFKPFKLDNGFLYVKTEDIAASLPKDTEPEESGYSDTPDGMEFIEI